MNQRQGEHSRSVKLFEGEKWLVLTGLLGFGLAVVCAVWVILFGGEVTPDGDVSKAFSFNAALGLFLLSTAAIVPLTGLGKRGRGVFRWGYIMLALYSYFAETVQHFRGVNPRFVEDGSKFDSAVGNIFAFVALLLVLFYLGIAISFFRRKTYTRWPGMVLGIRYAMAATFLSFAAGIWISVNQGSIVGLEGNIIWLHGLGFHALQAVPFVAWFAERRPLSAQVRQILIHTTGIAYLLGLVVVGWQTYLGYTIFEWSALPITAAVLFIIAWIPVWMILRMRTVRSGGFQRGV
ncbi:hypothetical protein [Marinicrinis lubricantis]|uniref:DUF2306 domain-containing protein n=1 Tax=Marinicrinis lubricantis TaxID=2086470 RepID=A0ABW1ILC3_9BACL